MVVYLDVVMGLNFTVDLLLLMASERLVGFPCRFWRKAAAAALGAVYAGLCALPGFSFLGNGLWRLVSLVGMSVIAYGWNKGALRRGCVFVFLSLALGGAALGMGRKGVLPLVAGALGILVLCCLGFRGKIGGSLYVPVELTYGSRQIRLTALQDTGNTLRDPVTGKPVLVVGADVAAKLLGFTRQQLQDPVALLPQVEGARLIPYQTVGKAGGLLLAIRIPAIKIGGWKGSGLVAFAPEGLGAREDYQALIGGTM